MHFFDSAQRWLVRYDSPLFYSENYLVYLEIHRPRVAFFDKRVEFLMQQSRITVHRRTMSDNWKESAAPAYLFSLKVLGRFDAPKNVARDKAAARADTEYRQRDIERAFSQNITTSSSSFKDQACILLPRDDRFNAPLSLSFPPSGFFSRE